MDTALIAYAFTAGMVATVNPCGFAMLPAYVSYYLATGEGEKAGVQDPWRRAGHALLGWHPDRRFRPLVRPDRHSYLPGRVCPSECYALGWTLYRAEPSCPGPVAPPGEPVARAWPAPGHYATGARLRHIFLFGVAYGLASLSCTLPIFLVVVGAAFAVQGVGVGILQFLAYGLGMGVVLMALTFSLALFEGVLVGYLRRLMPYVERADAVLLVAAGTYIVYYWLTAGQLLRAIG